MTDNLGLPLEIVPIAAEDYIILNIVSLWMERMDSKTDPLDRCGGIDESGVRCMSTPGWIHIHVS